MSDPAARGPQIPDDPDASEAPELPERAFEGKPRSAEAAKAAIVGTPSAEEERSQADRPDEAAGGSTAAPDKPKIGDTRPAPDKPKIGDTRPAPAADDADPKPKSRNRRRSRGGQGKGQGQGGNGSGKGTGNGNEEQAGRENGNGGQKDSRSNDARSPGGEGDAKQAPGDGAGGTKRKRRRGGRGRGNKAKPSPVQAQHGEPIELDEETLALRRGKERKGKPVGRYSMVVNVRPKATQIAILEGRQLIEHYVSRPSDDVSQIHGNVYLGKVQNVLPGMEAAFVDITTPKNAVLYRGDVQYDKEDIVQQGEPRIEQILKAGQAIICQVTKNPIAHKGARLTQEVSLPGRFCVLVPNSSTYGISKRLPDKERKRLRSVLDRVKPDQHGIIVRTAAENVTEEEIENDLRRLLGQWDEITRLASSTKAPSLLYREPDLAIRFIREEFSRDYRTVLIDDKALYEEMSAYVASVAPALAERIEYYDAEAEPLPVFERYHVAEQLRKALDKKVWLPSGGSLIIEHTEALTVIDVNTGKNVGKKSLEETVFHNNLEAADEIARQLRLRDIGGIIVIDFIDMEVKSNRDQVIKAFRQALARDKTRTQVFDISELGLVEMTRKRIGEGLLESLTTTCEHCGGLGHDLDLELIEL